MGAAVQWKMKHVGGDVAWALCVRGLNLLPSDLKNGGICTPNQVVELDSGNPG